MMGCKSLTVHKNKLFRQTLLWQALLLSGLLSQSLYAETTTSERQTLQQSVARLFTPQSDQNFTRVRISELSQFQLDTQNIQEMPRAVPASSVSETAASARSSVQQPLSFNDTIRTAVQRHPEISQAISTLAAQNASIDVAKSGYYPQLSGGISTADLTKGERGRQLLSLNATQMLYDFGKVKSSVNLEQARLAAEQANVLVSIDDIAYQTANAMINIKRYQEITRIAEEQIQGIARIAEITNLRAEAGISTQADPIQARSNLEAAEANLIVQQTQLRQFQQKLRTLVGFEVHQGNWQIPERLVKEAQLYSEPVFQQIPGLMAAQAEVEVAKLRKQQSRLSAYPTLNVKGSVSQAINGRNPNNNEDDGLYNSIMLEANSNFYQGGAIASQTRAASYAEESAKARVNSVYLEVLDETRMLREEIQNKQRQMNILVKRQATTIQTKELYQEQYKLGTRSAVDLLNAEQAIHSAAQEIENTRFDIYAAIARYISITGRTRDIYDLNHISIQGFEVQP